MVKIAQRMDMVQPSFYAKLDGRITQLRDKGVDVIRLDIGSPDLPPANHIIDSLAKSAYHPDHHGYQSIRGPQALRQAWASTYARLFDVRLDPDLEIVPLQGSKEGIFHFTLVNVEAGDIVLVPEPAYPTYAQAARFAGADVEVLPLRNENGYLPDLEAIPQRVAERARLLWLNYPNNPTGATASLEFFEAAVAFAHDNNLLLCHDAAYCQVTYDGYQAPSPLQIAGAREVAVEFNSLSKSHNMAGWRVGVLVGRAQAVGALRMLKPSMYSGQFKPITDAAAAALDGDQSWLTDRNETYRQRRDRIIEHLRAMGIKPAIPKAGLYVWMPIPEGWTCVDFAGRLLEDTGVSLTPGTVFGAAGEGYIRISLGASMERITEGMQRLADWWRKAIG